MLSRLRPPRRVAPGPSGRRALAGIALAGRSRPRRRCPPPPRPLIDQGQQQWVLDMLDVPTAWNISQGADVTVAVIDSGVAPDVSDLTGAVLTGKRLHRPRHLTGDPQWGLHGTWMASIIAGHGWRRRAAIIGVAPQAKLVSVRVIPDKGDPGYKKYDNEPESSDPGGAGQGDHGGGHGTREGDQHVDRLLGAEQRGPGRAAGRLPAWHRPGGVVRQLGRKRRAAHPQRPSRLGAGVVPGRVPGRARAWARSTCGGQPTSFSSGNLSVKVAAPGGSVPAQGRNGGYWLVSGTSPACALVAGVAALIKSRYPGLAPALVTRR